jgi:hypothetical protein
MEREVAIITVLAREGGGIIFPIDRINISIFNFFMFHGLFIPSV